MELNKIITDMMTERDNFTHDLYRYLSVLALFVGLGLQIYAIGWKGQPFDMQTFGIGTGTLFAGIGLALKLKPEGMNVPAP